MRGNGWLHADRVCLEGIFVEILCCEGCEALAQAVNVSSLGVFKAGLDGALSNLVYWKVALPVAVGLEWDDL